ncbi:EAL domain-containing protein [Pokkaliibacter sp. CJK22405]|uniref:two-component system response regulator n=1 Tax=Pokkaliibacter sp. CJK22405 TaxID=3384615 RepID=UPI0039852F00
MATPTRDVILLVDDQPSNIKVLHEAVESLGNIHFAMDGLDALEAARRVKPDLMLLDVQMPGMDGYEVCRTIKNDPELCDTAIIFVTAYAESENELRALEYGGVDFLMKPINIPIAQARVRTQLSLLRERKALARARQDLDDIINNIPGYVSSWTPGMMNLFSNNAQAQWFELSGGDSRGKSLHDIVGNDNFAALSPQVQQVLAGHTVHTELRLNTVDRGERTFDATFIPRREKREITSWTMVLNDITDLMEAQAALLTEKERLRVTLSSIADAVIATDLMGAITFMNPVAENLTGWTLSRAEGQPIEEVMQLCEPLEPSPLTNPVYRALQEGRVVETSLHTSLRRADGQLIDIEDSASPIIDHQGRPLGAITVFHDVSEARALAQKMSNMVNHDPLTGLPNRLILKERARRSLQDAKRKHHQVAMLVLDLDNFKTINESVGHSVGDQILKEVGARLKKMARPIDTISRHGGDEFIILLPELQNERELTEFVQLLMDTLREPVWVQQNRYDIAASLGIGLYPNDCEDVDTLYRHADSAMYQAKRAGRNRHHYFAPALEQAAVARHMMEKELRLALEEKRFELYYQAKMNANTNKLVGVEALLRLHDRQGKMVSPADFIPLAEETGLIVPIGQWVLEQACRHGAEWHQEGYPIRVAINVSAVQMREAGFDRQVGTILEETEVRANLVELEITEGVLATQIDRAADMLSALKQTGIQISMDDFGTGYCSLAYLKQFPIDVIKIDQSFVRDVLVDPSDDAIVSAIIRIAQGLKLRVVAEGVETVQQVNHLLEQGCHIMQGFYYCRPLPYDKMCEFIHDHSDVARLPTENWCL